MKYTKSLKGSINFKRVLKQGNFVNGENISIYYKKNNIEENLLGICVSKKHGNSVTRNKLKRWAREIYYIFEEEIKKSNSIIILYRKDIDVINLNFNILEEEIRGLLQKSGLLYEK